MNTRLSDALAQLGLLILALERALPRKFGIFASIPYAPGGQFAFGKLNGEWHFYLITENEQRHVLASTNIEVRLECARAIPQLIEALAAEVADKATTVEDVNTILEVALRGLGVSEPFE